jgi:hypothetical protein
MGLASQLRLPLIAKDEIKESCTTALARETSTHRPSSVARPTRSSSPWPDCPRHAGHHDAEKIKELPARFESGAHYALKLPGDLIELDTTQRVDLDALTDRIRELS